MFVAEPRSSSSEDESGSNEVVDEGDDGLSLWSCSSGVVTVERISPLSLNVVF